MSLNDRQAPGTLDIMMPFYGDPEQFRAAVSSILAQTDPHWRLVVIDDLYPSLEPGQWLQGLGDDRIEYHRNIVNLGVAGNFARCIELAAASHTVIIGCDDVLRPGYVGRMLELIQQFPDAAYFQPGVDVIDSDGRIGTPLPDRVKAYYRPPLTGTTELRGEELATSLLRGNWTYFPSICWRTETLTQHGFRADLDVVLDLALQIEIVMAGGSLVADTERTFLYRRHSASVSSWKANDGSRFREERAFFLSTAIALRARGWDVAAQAAFRHLSSRMNALTRVPAAVKAGSGTGVRSLFGHAFGRGQLVDPANRPAVDC
ncbi:glycosyltransferase family 2 protein [Leifsonia sp. A12D58]|uniref:glycosyltransferase family 2 protein n=1 Tax=Leifsonia sp. A12D58 TaxID=3397674 RepID=UPI0039E1A501